MRRSSSGLRLLTRNYLSGFSRLVRCERGNALIMATAVMIPLLGLVGSGIDLSRTYLARNKLQQACDAGVLAGRKVYTTSVDSNVTAEVRKYVNFNFPQGSNDTAAFAINPTAGADGAVNLSLATTVKMSIMKVFGFDTLAIATNCTGRQDFINTDVMLVLDTTLSMNCLPTDSASTYCTSEKSGSKISALRSAVVSFYDTLSPAQTKLEAAGLRLRYAMVPYSMTVNTGKLLYAANANWLKNPSNYQQCSGQNCGSVNNAAVNHSSSWFASTWTGCIEERSTANNIRTTSGYTIPANASDLDVDSLPNGNSGQWTPYDPAAATAKSGLAGIDAACPTQSRRLDRFATSSDMNSYVNSLTAGGYTYHDIGMIWGARLMSQSGLFASDNPTSYYNFPVNRHMIFMTDGAMDPDLSAYSAYGVEKHANGGRRVSGDGSQTAQDSSHTARFRMMCNKVKSMNISVWVIAFGTSSGTGLTSDLQNCASSPSQAFKVDDQAALNAKFTQIGQSIGALRLSQ